MTTIVVADEHALFAGALGAVLDHEDDLTCIGTTSDAAEVVAMAEQAELVVLGLRLAGSDGLSIADEILYRRPETRAVLVTPAPSAEGFARAVEYGFCACVSKADDLAVLVAAVRSAARGEAQIPITVITDVLGRLRKDRLRKDRLRKDRRSGDPLTEQQLKVLRMLVDGGSIAQIAAELGRSGHTVRNHVRAIFAKLGVHTQRDAVLAALRLGLVETPLATASSCDEPEPGELCNCGQPAVTVFITPRGRVPSCRP